MYPMFKLRCKQLTWRNSLLNTGMNYSDLRDQFKNQVSYCFMSVLIKTASVTRTVIIYLPPTLHPPTPVKSPINQHGIWHVPLSTFPRIPTLNGFTEATKLMRRWLVNFPLCFFNNYHNQTRHRLKFENCLSEHFLSFITHRSWQAKDSAGDCQTQLLLSPVPLQQRISCATTCLYWRWRCKYSVVVGVSANVLIVYYLLILHVFKWMIKCLTTVKNVDQTW